MKTEIKIRPIKDLKLNSKNPRYAKDAAFRSLIKSIKDFPEMLSVRPIIVDEKNVILGGNMRYLAAIEAGLKEVPTIQIKLSEKQKKEFIIKDNVQSGQWDIDTLANEWDQDLLAGWGLDIVIPELSGDIEQLDEEDLGDHKPKDKKEVYQILVEFQNEKELAKAMKEFAAKGYEAKRLKKGDKKNERTELLITNF